MKHPALARVFSVVLAIVALIQLAVGVRGLRETGQEHAERGGYAERFERRIETYRSLRAELAARPDYDRTMKALDTFTSAHEKAAGKHKTDTAIYTATKGGLKMGEDLIVAGREELLETREQLQDPETRRVLMESTIAQVLASQENIMAEINRLAGNVRGCANRAYAEYAKYAGEASGFRALLDAEPLPPEEPVMPPEPQPPEEPLQPAPPEEAVEPVPPEEPVLQTPELPEATPEELAAAMAEAEAQYQAELAAYGQACEIYRQERQRYEEALAQADALDEAYREALAAWETEHALWEAAFAEWETEHARWEESFANWEEEHARWENDYAAWELEHAAWEQMCRTFKEQTPAQDSLNILEQLGEELSEAAAQAGESLAECSNLTGKSYPKLEELIACGAETAEQIRELGEQCFPQMDNALFLALCERAAQLAQLLGDGFSQVAACLENPGRSITELVELLGMSDDLVDFLNVQLDKAEHQLQAALEELWYQAGELQKDKIKLEAEKRGLDSEAKVLAEHTAEADSLKDLRSRHNAARLVLINVPEIKSLMTDEESIPVAAEAYLQSYRERTDSLFKGRRLINALAIAGGVMGAAGIPAAYELLKKRFWLIAPVLLCLLCSAAAEALNLKLGLGQLYVSLATALLALVQLLIVLPQKKRVQA